MNSRTKKLVKELVHEAVFVLVLVASAVPIILYQDRLPLWLILTLGLWPIFGGVALWAAKLFKNKGDDL